jgi:hypothetical protein
MVYGGWRGGEDCGRLQVGVYCNLWEKWCVQTIVTLPRECEGKAISELRFPGRGFGIKEVAVAWTKWISGFVFRLCHKGVNDGVVVIASKLGSR